ncbi:MAG TPA: DNA mismatch repair protein [Pedobacter sp.]
MMTNLATDEQTIEDLGIFGKHNDSGIYHLYDQTQTRGGEALLKKLFLHPIADKDEINRRSGIIEYFATRKIAFPFDAILFDMAEKYLTNVQEQGKIKGQKVTLGEREIQYGVTAIIALIQGLGNFIMTEDVIALAAYHKEREQIVTLLADPALKPVLSETVRDRLPYTAIAAYDVLFSLQEYNKIQELLGYIYHLDVYLSVAKLAGERKLVFPKALEKGLGVLRLKGVYHPELKHPVANTIIMDNHNSVIFLTGANMAGKSTFLRSVSTAVYVAHIGFPVAAEAMEFSVLDGMYTTINLPDNLGMGASHFYNEVLRVKKIATQLHQGKALFVVFDELFRGTNVKDAHEATVAVTNAFAKKTRSLFIISSHIVEAGEELKKAPNIGFQYLPTRMNGHIPEYTYTLEQGITDDRHGMIIIRNEGILDILKKGRENMHLLIKKMYEDE